MADAVNPIRFANAPGNQLEGVVRLSAMISQEINLLLKDSSNLRNSGLISYQGSINGLGSDTVRVRLAGLDGYDSFSAATNEISDENTATALTIDSADLVAARQYLLYEMSDLASMTGLSGSQDIDPFRLARSMSLSYETRFAELTGAAAANFSTSVGANTTTLSIDDFFDAIFAIEQAADVGAQGPFAAVLSPKALTEIQDSLRNETGNAVSRMQSSQEMLMAKGANFAGNLFGVDVYRSGHVNENGSSGYDNYLISPMALGYVDGIPANIPGSADLMSMGKIVVEFDRRPMSAKTFIVGHAYIGLGIIQDDKGVKILSAR